MTLRFFYTLLISGFILHSCSSTDTAEEKPTNVVQPKVVVKKEVIFATMALLIAGVALGMLLAPSFQSNKIPDLVLDLFLFGGLIINFLLWGKYKTTFQN